MAVYVDDSLCKGCRLCVAACPKKVMQMTSEVNRKGFNVATAVGVENCIKCGICERTCPDFAIHVE